MWQPESIFVVTTLVIVCLVMFSVCCVALDMMLDRLRRGHNRKSVVDRAAAEEWSKLFARASTESGQQMMCSPKIVDAIIKSRRERGYSIFPVASDIPHVHGYKTPGSVVTPGSMIDISA